MNTNSPWDAFFGNPVIGHYLEEAEIQAQDYDTPVPEMPQDQDAEAGSRSNEDLDQLAQDIQSGALQQSDLIDMYKSGKISKEEVQQIMQAASGEEQPQEGEQQVDPETGEPQLSEEELFAQQIDQTNDLFIKFTLYDKIVELTEKLDYFKENFEDMQSETYTKVLQLSEFLNILSNLVFNIETTVSYQMYGSILLQLTEIFQEYNSMDEREKIQSRREERENSKYRDGSKSADPVENWANDNKSSYMNSSDAPRDPKTVNKESTK